MASLTPAFPPMKSFKRLQISATTSRTLSITRIGPWTLRARFDGSGLASIVESVIESLKEHNSALSTDRAAEIATTALRFVERSRIQHPKEN